jgi:phage terminase large subunit-like protein
MQGHPRGEFVLYSDYARLKAELTDLKSTTDRFKAEVESLMTNPTSRLLRAEREENARLKAEVERLTERLGGVRLIVTEEMYDELNTKYLEQQHELQNIALTARQILDEKIDLKEQVERLTKAVMHSPAAQLKLKELEGKTTFDEINPDNQ